MKRKNMAETSVNKKKKHICLVNISKNFIFIKPIRLSNTHLYFHLVIKPFTIN